MTDTMILTSLAEYIATEEAAHDAPKREYEEGVIIEMTGGSLTHNRIIKNITVRLAIALDGEMFEVLISEMRVRPPTSATYYYPDLSVVASAPCSIPRGLPPPCSIRACSSRYCRPALPPVIAA
ncbi:MAG: Uma2 family endonuclease [Chloroflexaceae bacterium]|nr:Uma2 family endonuclease [Chloroflexaceae bacterium]